MPVFEFACRKCGYNFEKIVRSNDVEEYDCPECNSKAFRKVSSINFSWGGNGLSPTTENPMSSGDIDRAVGIYSENANKMIDAKGEEKKKILQQSGYAKAPIAENLLKDDHEIVRGEYILTPKKEDEKIREFHKRHDPILKEFAEVTKKDIEAERKTPEYNKFVQKYGKKES